MQSDSQHESTRVEATNVNENKNPNDGDEETSLAKKLKVTENDNEPNKTTKNETDEAADKMLKKRKYALLIGYCGEGYFGLQRLNTLT